MTDTSCSISSVYKVSLTRNFKFLAKRDIPFFSYVYNCLLAVTPIDRGKLWNLAITIIPLCDDLVMLDFI